MNKLEQKTKFLDNGIPYDELDTEMIDLIDVLNFDLKLKTEFCCYGHSEHEETYVVFDKEVTDKAIFKLAKLLSHRNFGSFNKWVRSIGINNELKINWTYKSSVRFNDKDPEFKKMWLDSFVNSLRECA